MIDQSTSPINSTETWHTLSSLARQATSIALWERFAADSDRGARFSGELGELFVDYAKHHLDGDLLNAFARLADDAKLQEKLDAMRSGAAANTTEARPACYPILRSWSPQQSTGTAELDAMYQQMTELVTAIHNGSRRSVTGKSFTDVVNIGIGGSDFGPRMICDALSNQGIGKLKTHFVANIDPSVISDVLARVPADSTLFLVASKSFGTQETRANAGAARTWLKNVLQRDDVQSHFLAITSNPSAAADFGIAAENILSVPEWIGGRFSVWSGFGLPVALYAGMETFQQFLHGGREVDAFVEATPLQQNIPLILGMLDVWYRNFWGYTSQAILPYEHRLNLLPTYLQQLMMESAGKSVNHQGERLTFGTGNVIWGTEGTNGQHSFHQLLHQGSDVIPCDFITALRSYNPLGDQHQALVANCFSQSLVLMNGQQTSEIEAELIAQGMPPAEATILARHKAMPGNRPSTTIVMEQLTPQALGNLIALYEYRLFAASFIWDINPFDQWGVERGKQVSKMLTDALTEGKAEAVDSSTAQLVARFAQANK